MYKFSVSFKKVVNVCTLFPLPYTSRMIAQKLKFLLQHFLRIAPQQVGAIRYLSNCIIGPSLISYKKTHMNKIIQHLS